MSTRKTFRLAESLRPVRLTERPRRSLHLTGVFHHRRSGSALKCLGLIEIFSGFRTVVYYSGGASRDHILNPPRQASACPSSSIPNITMGPDATWQKPVEDMAKAKELVFWLEKEAYLPSVLRYHLQLGVRHLVQPGRSGDGGCARQPLGRPAGAFKKSTKTSGSDSSRNPLINIIACTTLVLDQRKLPRVYDRGADLLLGRSGLSDKKRQPSPTPQTMSRPSSAAAARRSSTTSSSSPCYRGIYPLRRPTSGSSGTTSTGSSTRPPSPRSVRRLPRPEELHIHKLAMILTAAQSD